MAVSSMKKLVVRTEHCHNWRHSHHDRILSVFTVLGTVAIISNLKYRKYWPAAVVIVLFTLVAVSPVSIPISEIRHPKREFIEPRDLSGYHEQVRKSVEMMYSSTIMKVGASPYSIYVSTNMATPREIPENQTEALFNARRKDAAFGKGALARPTLHRVESRPQCSQ